MPHKPLLSATLCKADLSKLRFPLLASPKIDGIRGLCEDRTVFSRTGKPIPNHFIQQCFFGWEVLHGLDGELVVGPPNVPSTYKTTRGPVMTREGEPDFTFWVFDMVDRDVYVERLRRIRTTFAPSVIPWLKVVEQKAVHSVSDVLSYEEAKIAEGYEGIMVRDPLAYYKHNRSTLREQILMKLKRFTDDEAEIIGFEERMQNTNEDIRDNFGYAKRSSAQDGLVGYGDLGAFQVKMVTGKFAGTTCKVGTGFTASERQQFWAQRSLMLGQTCTIKWFEPGSDKAPRLPSWKGLRSEGE